MLTRFGSRLPPIQEVGDYVLYHEVVSWGHVAQISPQEFEFRPNVREDIMEWFREDCHHGCEILMNDYRARVVFDNPSGATEFKLRWC